MKVGDKIKIDFAGKKKDAVVFRLFPNSVHLKVDFEKDKGKILKRKLNQVEDKKPAAGKEKNHLYDLKHSSCFGEDSPFSYFHKNLQKLFII